MPIDLALMQAYVYTRYVLNNRVLIGHLATYPLSVETALRWLDGLELVQCYCSATVGYLICLLLLAYCHLLFSSVYCYQTDGALK